MRDSFTSDVDARFNARLCSRFKRGQVVRSDRKVLVKRAVGQRGPVNHVLWERK